MPARPDSAYLLYRGGAALFRLLPRRVGLRLGSGAGALFGALAPARRRIVAANLAHVADADDRPHLDALTRRAFREYGRYWAATARLAPRDRRRIDELVVVEGEEYFRLFEQGPVIYALPHLGAWEIGGFWTICHGLRLTTVVEPAKTPRLRQFFSEVREALGLDLVELGPATAGELLRRMDEGRSVALVADRDLLGDGIAVEFFGAKTRLPAGPALLALRAGAPLVPVGTYLLADGRTRIVFCPPLAAVREGRLRDDVVRLTEALATSFEGLIAADPAQWHVFQPNWPEEAPAVEGTD